MSNRESIRVALQETLPAHHTLYSMVAEPKDCVKNAISATLAKEEYLIDTTRAKAIQSLGWELQSRIENGDNAATFSRFCEDLIFLLKSLFDNVKSKNCSNSKKENSCGLFIIRKL